MARLARRTTLDGPASLAVIVALIAGAALSWPSAGPFTLGVLLALVAGFSALWSP